MAIPTETQVRECLAAVRYPGFSRDIISFGLLKEIRIDETGISVRLEVSTTDPNVPQLIKEGATAVLRDLAGAGQLDVIIDSKPPAQTQLSTNAIPGVKQVIAVASGKGGVGKSTVSANLAVALGQTGARAGLCDCDIYGPSIALMFGAREPLLVNDREQILPAVRHGVRLVSMGLLLGDDSPAILRGPMVTRFTQQFLRQVDWEGLDYLVLDLPPGTGDIQLTIVQTVALSGAVIVTTPQEVALIDARKAASMFERVNVPVFGIVENMSYFRSEDATRHDIFGKGGGAREAKRLGVPLLAEIPIDIATREAGDKGKPIAAADPKNPVSVAFREVAGKIRLAAPI